MSLLRKPMLLATILTSMLFLTSCALPNNVFSQGNNEGNGDSSSFTQIEIAGESNVSGIFDPSLEYDQDGTGWMTYSWVKWPDEVVTHLAKSTDKGASWEFVKSLNAKSYQNINGKRFVWRYETSTILYDPTDTPAKRWKFYVQRVPALASSCKVKGGCLTVWNASSIWYRYAASPEGDWSAETCLFGKAEWGCKVDINNLDAKLSGNKGYNELGSLVKDGVIYLSMDSFTTDSALGEWEKRKIILLSSSDHGASWNYVGDLTNYSDSINAKYRAFTASSLVHKGDTDYLLLAPSGAVSGANKAHNGTWIIEFNDISRAELNRDEKGHLVVTKKIGITKNNGGESDYDEQNTAGGIVFPQLDFSEFPAGEWFQIYNSNQSF